MKLSTLALQISLFAYPGADAAFVQHHNRKSLGRPDYRRHRRYKKGVPSLVAVEVESSAASASAASSSTSAEVTEPSLVICPRRHPLFHDTNAVSKPMPVPHPELWRRSLPTASKAEPADGERKKNAPFWSFLTPQCKPDTDPVLLNDVHVQFDDPATGARRLLEHCGVIHPSYRDDSDDGSSFPLPEMSMAEEETAKHLAAALSYFQSVAATPNGPQNVQCIGRIVSTIGSAGIKCPRWHADHVPVRLVMSIIGPGCEYIPENVSEEERIVNRRALNNLDEDDTRKANDIIVPPVSLKDAKRRRNGEGERIRHAKEAEAVLLMGRGWEDDAITSLQGERVERRGSVLAAVHRSPVLSPGEERILLTVDLVDWD